MREARAETCTARLPSTPGSPRFPVRNRVNVWMGRRDLRTRDSPRAPGRPVGEGSSRWHFVAAHQLAGPRPPARLDPQWGSIAYVSNVFDGTEVRVVRSDGEVEYEVRTALSPGGGAEGPSVQARRTPRYGNAFPTTRLMRAPAASTSAGATRLSRASSSTGIGEGFRPT